MTEYLVELYVSKTNCAAVALEKERLEHAAAELTAEGSPVRVLQSIFVPDDETCFLLVEAATFENVREIARRSAVRLERVVETADETANHERSTIASSPAIPAALNSQGRLTNPEDAPSLR
jgi:hypothetical protein